MTVEYVLLVALFAISVMGVLIKGPTSAFKNAAPKLGARVERQIMTGDGFTRGGKSHKWEVDR